MEDQIHLSPKDSIDSFSVCRVKDVVSGKLVQCLEKNSLCPNTIYFGKTVFCKLPFQNEGTQNNNPKTNSTASPIFNEPFLNR